MMKSGVLVSPYLTNDQPTIIFNGLYVISTFNTYILSVKSIYSIKRIANFQKYAYAFAAVLNFHYIWRLRCILNNIFGFVNI